jgi:hypothetical protein
MTWPASVSDHFLSMISRHEPVAIILLAHFAVLMAEMRRVWWLEHWAERLVNAAQQSLQGVPTLHRWLRWPLEKAKAFEDQHCDSRQKCDEPQDSACVDESMA